MSMFTLPVSCLTTSNLPWFMDLTFQVPMQYCFLQQQTLLLSPVTSTTGYCFFCLFVFFGSTLSFFLELFPHWYRIWRTKRCPSHYRGLEYKSGKSRNTWSNSQFWHWRMEWSRAKANRVLPRECTGHCKHPLPTTQENSTHGHHQMVNTKIVLIYSLQPKMEKL